MKRTSQIKRKTKETDIELKLNLDGKGKAQIKTGIGFLNHMLDLFTCHGLFDLSINVKSQDLDVDIHHTNEDVGICLGQAFKKAFGDKKSITRFGDASVPMEESKAAVVLDISGRNSLYLNTDLKDQTPTSGEGYSLEDTKHFLTSFTREAGINLNVEVSGDDFHHYVEAIFKALGRAMDKATTVDVRVKGVPSTKGKL